MGNMHTIVEVSGIEELEPRKRTDEAVQAPDFLMPVRGQLSIVAETPELPP